MRTLEQMDFGGLQIAFDDRVLRPRPWTAAQARWAAELLRAAPPGDVLELCAGAGQLGLLAVADNDRRLVAVDLNPVAVDFTRTNAEAAGLLDRVQVRQGPLDEVLGPDEQFAVVIADPPWVCRRDVGRYPQDPVLAIDGGDDGLAVAWRCLDVIDRHLADGGSAVLQLGTPEQVARVRASLNSAGPLRVVASRRHADRGVLVRIDRGRVSRSPG
ncbi:MAG TPA: class I SAM-dependent methyltransferase [Segeticoccus sp.]|uniref:class I SAM-dependent methyltransferase n=1 Tax=Segeticoccus sp. TaxID=2706531 RepID=UPI002D810602|nr:class I SAM-dependent methyltransferase [Segeticoccus sp.]HET8601646.1 class I SAM-dependent methyltransferase [Segeticoccus sp.]